MRITKPTQQSVGARLTPVNLKTEDLRLRLRLLGDDDDDDDNDNDGDGDGDDIDEDCVLLRRCCLLPFLFLGGCLLFI